MCPVKRLVTEGTSGRSPETLTETVPLLVPPAAILSFTTETVGGGCRDQVAVDAIMGHVDPSMGANYRHNIGDDRLTDHIHDWLFPIRNVSEEPETVEQPRGA